MARKGPGPEQVKKKNQEVISHRHQQWNGPSSLLQGIVSAHSRSSTRPVVRFSPFPEVMWPTPLPLYPNTTFQSSKERGKIQKSEQLSQSFDLSLKRLKILGPNWAETSVCVERGYHWGSGSLLKILHLLISICAKALPGSYGFLFFPPQSHSASFLGTLFPRLVWS